MGIGRAGWRFGLAALILVALVAAWATRSRLPTVLRNVLQRQLALQAEVALEVGDLALSLVPPRLIVTDLSLSRRGERLLVARRLELRLALLRSLWQRTWIGDVELDEPKLVADDRAQTWRDLAGALRSGAAGPSGEPGILPHTLIVRSGSVDVRLSGAGIRTVLTDIHLESTLGGVLQRRVEFDATAHATFERGGRRVELTRVAARGRFSPRDVVIDSGVVDGGAGRIRLSGALDEDSRLRGQLVGDLSLDAIFALVPEAGIVRGGGRISARVSGTAERPQVDADLVARAVRIHDVEFSGHGTLESGAAEWSLAKAQVQIFGGEAQGDARGKWSFPVPFEARGRFAGWDPAMFVGLFGPPTPLTGKWNGDARIAGVLGGDDLRGGGEFSLEQSKAKLTGSAAFTVARQNVEVEARVQASPADTLRARYRVMSHAISGDVEATTQNLGIFGGFVGLELEGRGTARAEFAGTLEQPRFAGQTDLADVVVQGIPIGGARGQFEISREGLDSPRMELAGGEIEFSGRLALTPSQDNRWTASIHHASVNRAVPVLRLRWPAVPDFGGALDGEAQGSGPWAAVRLVGHGRMNEARIATERVGDGTIDITLGDGSWSARGRFLRDDGAACDLSATLDRRGDMNARLSANGWRLEHIETLRARWSDIRGGARLQASLGGTVARPSGELALVLSQVELAGRSLGDGGLRVRATGEEVVADGELDRIRFSANAAVRPPHAFRARAQWSDFDLGPFLAAVPGMTVRTTGGAELRGDAAQPLDQGETRLDALVLEHGAYRLENRAPVSMRVTRGEVDVPDAVFGGSGQEVVVGGHWKRDEAVFHASGTGDLALLESLSTRVASARGRITADIRAARDGDQPWRYHGRVRLDGGALDLAFLVGVTDIAGELALDDRRFELRELNGKLAGGGFRIVGTVTLDSGWNLDWTIRDASFGVPSWLDYRANGHGRILGSLDRPSLSGDVDVAQALYDRRIEWTEFLPWFRRQGIPSRAGAGIPLAIDLHVFADGGLFIDNNLAKVEMRTDLRLRGDGERLAWSGNLDVLDGDFYFRRRQFTITAGGIQFHEDRPTNPDLQFRGETRVSTRDEEYEIQVRVTGTADDPRIEFTSDDPTLTERDVLALVTFGRTVAQLQRQGAGIELTEVLALTAGPDAATVEKRLHTFLPVDRIEIEPTFSRVSGASEPRLSIAKELAERLSAVVGTGLGSERRQDVGLEYQMTRRFSLQGVWESQTKSEAGAVGANLKFRLPFRTLPRFSLLPGEP
jgi:autotransporter translocation and assembly factor TamB